MEKDDCGTLAESFDRHGNGIGAPVRTLSDKSVNHRLEIGALES